MASYDDLDALLTALTEAAIDADMWERSFTWKDGDHYQDPMGDSHVYRGDPGRNELAPSDEGTDFEAEVFNRWPAEIEKIFAAWRADVLPDPANFRSQIDALHDCARPIGLPSLIEPPAALRAAGPPAGGGGGMSGLVADLSGSTGPLKGSWVDAFHREYVVPLPYVLGNQAAMLELLGTSIEVEAEMWLQVRQSVADLAETGAEWFKATMHGGNVWELVVEVAKAMHTVFNLRRAKDPVKVGTGVLALIGHVTELKSLIDSNAPPDPRETGVPNNVAGVKTKIAQTLEYTINGHIVFTEERLETLLRGSMTAMRTSPGTFTMGDSQLERVRSAAQILAPEQLLTERGVERAVSSLFTLGDQVTSAASGILTSVYPFVRPGSIGLGSSGPYDAVLDLENEILHAMHDTAFNLARAATAVRISADYAFAADADAAGALGRVNDRLDRAQREFEESVRPSGRGMSPYTPPDVDVHVEVPPCGPDDDPFADAPAPPQGVPFAPVS